MHMDTPAMISLKGQFLLSMPGMTDERFAGAMICMVEHGEDGAMGLVVNRSLKDMRFADILKDLKLGSEDELIRLPQNVREREVLRGGPVERGRGFVLHSGDYAGSSNSFAVEGDIRLSATMDALKAVAFGPGPSKALFALGYCGWGPGQLEAEIGANGWLTVPFDPGLLFDTPTEQRYDEALASLGISRAFLSSDAGNA